LKTISCNGLSASFVVFFSLKCNNINRDLYDTNPHLIHSTKGVANPVGHRAAEMQKMKRTNIIYTKNNNNNNDVL
jgi:hypothetical protein